MRLKLNNSLVGHNTHNGLYGKVKKYLDFDARDIIHYNVSEVVEEDIWGVVGQSIHESIIPFELEPLF